MTGRRSPPSARKMAWLGMWNRDIEELSKNPWNHAASFPVELTLHQDESTGYSIRRNPVKEIRLLTDTVHYFPDLEISGENNPLQHIDSEAFDLEFTLDAGNSTATEICIQVSDRKIVLDVPGQKLENLDVSLVEGKIKIRLLRDRAAYELFVNGGRQSKAEEFPFDPDQSGISIQGTGSIKVTDLTIRELRSIWH